MSRKNVILASLLVLLIALMGAQLRIKNAKASTIIHIKADGSIEGTDKIQRDGDVYTFTDNIYDSTIVVELDNIVVDGAGCTLQGTGDYNSKAFHISGRSNVTIKNMTITMFHYGIDLSYSSYNIISGNNITNNACSIGICFSSSHNSVCGNNITMNNDYAIFIGESSNNNISRNSIRVSNFNGIILQSCSNNNIISGNHITESNDNAIWLNFSSKNAVTGNIITNNEDAIMLSKCSNNTISENNVTANYGVGIGLWDSSHNSIYHNIFASNPLQAYTENSTNVWDDGYPSGGNHWSNYADIDKFSGSNQDQPGSDGIGDTARSIDENNTDHYPLIAPINTFKAGTFENVTHYVNVISNSIVSNFFFNPNEGTFIRFNVTGESGTAGFCRVTIPNNLLWVEDGWTVLVGEQETNYTTIPDENFTYLYFTYDHTTKNVEIQGTHVIPEFPTGTVLPLFMVFSIIIVILAKRKNPTKLSALRSDT